MKFACGLAAFALVTLPAFAAPEPFYLGTYTDHSTSKGIYRCSLDSETGALGSVTFAANAPDPSFLAFDPNAGVLYATEETQGPGAIESWKRAPDGSLTPLNKQPSGGDGPCFITLDPANRNVLVSNYVSGTFACFPIATDGSLGASSSLLHFDGSGPNKTRQESSHAHSIYISPDSRFAYGCDLGADAVRVMSFDATKGKLVTTSLNGQVRPGSGPRHGVFSRDAKTLYVVDELGHTVVVFTRAPFTGGLTPVQIISTSPLKNPTGLVAPAEMALSANGKWLYVSNRGSDTISVFSTGAFGRLRRVQDVPSIAKGPRSFAVDPSGRWMVVAGEVGHGLAVLRIDPRTGKLSATTQTAACESPVCVLFPGKT